MLSSSAENKIRLEVFEGRLRWPHSHLFFFFWFTMLSFLEGMGGKQERKIILEQDPPSVDMGPNMYWLMSVLKDSRR